MKSFLPVPASLQIANIGTVAATASFHVQIASRKGVVCVRYIVLLECISKRLSNRFHVLVVTHSSPPSFASGNSLCRDRITYHRQRKQVGSPNHHSFAFVSLMSGADLFWPMKNSFTKESKLSQIVCGSWRML